MEAFNKVKPKKIKLSDYDMNRVLGSGSFGRVKLAKNKSDGRYVAIKILKKAEIIKSNQTEHIFNELDIMPDLDHPFILKFVSFFQDVNYLYLA